MGPGPAPGGSGNPGESTPKRSPSVGPQVTVESGNKNSQDPTGLPQSLRKFTGKNGAFIFVIGAQSSQVGQAINQLTEALDIDDRVVEVQGGHTMIGLKYSGPLDEVSKNFKFGRISYIDEDARTIHVQAE